MKHNKTISDAFLRIAQWVFIGLLAYMPLHIFLSTWLGASFGLLEELRIAKDIVLFLGFLIVGVLALKNKSVIKELRSDRLVWLIVGYGILTLLLALMRPTDTDAELLGLVYNTRFLVFFLYALILSRLVDKALLRKRALLAVFVSAFIVLAFGVIQYVLLPNDALRHVGYARENGVLPAFFIDDKPDLERIMSTLRDPNSLGSYLIIIGSLAGALAIKRPYYRQLGIGFLLLSLLNVWFSFSRSAWIGFIVAMFVLGIFGMKERVSRKALKRLIIAALVFIAALSSVVFIFRESYFVRNTIFHADEATVLEDPNELRLRFWRESAQNIVADPVGSGPGTAGIVSIRNNVQGVELNENYYLQVASEVGIVGLAIFLGILAIAGWRLMNVAEKDWLALGLLASFAGLLITNFLVHIWSNEAVAYSWWGLAGIALTNSLKAGNSHNKKLNKH